MSARFQLSQAELRAVLLAGTASGVLFAAPAYAQPESDGAQQSPANRLTVPLLVDGRYRGDVPVSVIGDKVEVFVDRFIDLLGPQLSDSMKAQLAGDGRTDATIGVDTLNALGINASFDAATLEFRVSVPLASQGSNRISAVPDIGTRQERNLLQPSSFSASSTFIVTQSRVWSSPVEQKGFRPVQVTADLAANIGGAEGVFLFSQHTYDGASRSFRRGNSQAVFDLTKQAIRVVAGDVAPSAAGFQTSPLMGGVTVQRAYNELQPLRNIRPSGQARFVLDRPAIVDVVVNGTAIRSLQLQPGNYDLGQLPYVNGLNEVELYVQDEQGRRLLARFSQFFAAQMLARGVFDFSVTGGIRQNLSGRSRRYETSRPGISGWARYGVSDSLTLGTNLQAEEGLAAVGVEASLATPLGVVSGMATGSRAGGSTGRSLLVAYEGEFDGLGPVQQVRVDADWRATSADFRQLDQAFAEPVKSQVQARVTGMLGEGLSFGGSFIRSRGRGNEPDRRQYSLQLRKAWGRFDLSASADRRYASDAPREDRGLITASLRLGTRQDLRSSFDTRGNTARIEYARFARDELGTLGLRAGVERSNGNISATGQADYNASFARVSLDHRAFETAGNGGRGVTQESRYTVSTQVATAGRRLALGRPVGPRFAIVSAHRTLKGSRIGVRGIGSLDRPSASARSGRGALVGLGSPYVPSQVRVDVDRLPVGYDIGPGEYEMNPPPAAGYAITVGSEASRVIMGVALDDAGQPLAQMGGLLVSLDRPDAEPMLVFTNRNGRFVVSGLTPGRYELRLGKDGQWRIPVVVPRSGEPTIALGPLQLSSGRARR